MEITHDYKGRAGALPLPATLSMVLGDRLGGLRSGSNARLYSRHPFPWREAQSRTVFEDPFAQAAWEALTTDPTRPHHAFVEVDGHPTLRFAVPDRMRPDCVGCHNSHPQSPRRDWKVDDVRGVLEVTVPLDQSLAQAAVGVRLTLGLALMMAVGMLLLVARGLREQARHERVLAETAQEAQRSADEAHRALEQATALARSNEDLEQFAYAASHDLRAPLRKIRQFGDLLKMRTADSLGEDATLYVDRMTAAAARMDELLADLLEFSRVSGAESLHGNVSLFDVTAEVLEDLEVIVREAGGRVQVDRLPPVRGDRTQLRLLLQNLIDNGLKFHRAGEPPVVHVSGGVDPDDADRVRVAVRDEGIGLDPTRASRIFDVFGRLHGPQEYPGTGIGLALCKKIVERHGGRLAVESAPGEGATFSFTLPAAAPEESERPQGDSSDAA